MFTTSIFALQTNITDWSKSRAESLSTFQQVLFLTLMALGGLAEVWMLLTSLTFVAMAMSHIC